MGGRFQDIHEKYHHTDGIQIGLKNAGNDAPELHAPCIQGLYLHEKDKNSWPNYMKTEPGNMQGRIGNERITQGKRQLFCQQDSYIIDYDPQQRQHDGAVFIFYRNGCFHDVTMSVHSQNPPSL